MKYNLRYSLSFALPLVPFLALVMTAELFVRIGWIAPYLVPAPSNIFMCLWTDRVELFSALFQTALSAVLGFALSIVIGIAAALLLTLSTTLRKMFYPYAVFFQTVPVIAIAPLLVIWFGYGRPSVVACAFIVSVFPMLSSTLSGLLATDLALLDLFALYRARPLQIFFKLRLPYALPQILDGLRVSSGLAIIGAIVGEFISGHGLGSVIDVARTQYRVDKVFAAVLLASLLGVVGFFAVKALSVKLLRHWHPSEKN